MLRKWVAAPLADAAAIRCRLDAVEVLAGPAADVFLPVKEMIGKLPDLQRAATSIFYRKCSAADCAAALESLSLVYTTIAVHKATIAAGCSVGTLSSMLSAIHEGLAGISDLLRKLDLNAAKTNDKVNLFVGDAVSDDVRRLKDDIKGIERELRLHLRDVAATLGNPNLKE